MGKPALLPLPLQEGDGSGVSDQPGEAGGFRPPRNSRLFALAHKEQCTQRISLTPQAEDECPYARQCPGVC